MSVPQECREVLLAKNLSIYKVNRSARLFMASLTDKNTYENINTQTGGQYGLIAGHFDALRERYNIERQQSSLQFSQDEAFSALTLNALPGAVQAWRDCMLAHKAGLFCWLEGDLTALYSP